MKLCVDSQGKLIQKRKGVLSMATGVLIACSHGTQGKLESAYTLKNSKGPVFPLRSILVFFISLFGFYVCYFSFSQITFENEGKLTTKDEPIKIPCRAPAIPHEQLPYVHFPKPVTYDRGECACTPVRFFVIISMQRSGSGWFETLVNSHPNVSSNGEIFSVKDRRENISSILRTLDKLYNMDWLTSAAKNECTAAFGLKWMLNQALSRVQEFLGVPVKKLFSKHVKIHTSSLPDLVDNWEDVNEMLNGTEYARFLDDADYVK
ncbi:hypothetical protein EJB05_06494, partial [Eragrostis curvula]